ncbi:hypothetical protein AB0I45_01055 [Brevibacterium sp. NPDC049920]|uniref:hypothetical protein n=1 Tax=Brevibacterium sp. NPDC049920 TaxID=3155279 RepID=UPI0025E268B6|nr:hypothetical protein [uncultured Brevibacterium sp.]
MGITLGIKRHRALPAVGAALGLALVASGCAGSAGQASGGHQGESFAHGASLEETQAAFADVEPITLAFQTGASAPDGPLGQTYQNFADQVNEWSDGKVTIELNWAGSIAALTEVDDALADGRLDLGQLSFTYQPQEFPITNNMNDASVAGAVTPLSGEIAQTLGMLQATVNTPAVYEEYAEKGVTPLLPIAHFGTTGMACSEPVSSVDDLEGLQILPNSTVQSRQVEALGGVVVSVEYTELYEAFQRGIVDCALAVPPVYQGMGLTEVAPYFYYPEDTNFQSGPTSILAGSSWESLPLPARQLVYDKIYEWLKDSNHAAFRYLSLSAQESTESGGEIGVFDKSVSEALAAANEEILAEQSATDLYDAADFADRYTTAVQQWQQEALATGFTDDGSFSNLGDWYQGDLTSASADYLADFYAGAFEQAAGSKRPE